MTVSENLLFQMYQMMDNIKLPEVTPSTSGRESEKSSFQDLMDQTRKDAVKSENNTQNKDEVNQTKQPDKTAEKADSTSAEQGEELSKLEDSNYAALSYLLRPEIQMISEEPVEPTSQPTLVVSVERESAVQPLISQNVPAESVSVSEQLLPTQQTTENTQTFVSAQSSQAQTPVQSEVQQAQTPFTQTMTVAAEESDASRQTELTPANTPEEDVEVDVLVSSDAPQQPVFREVEGTPIKVGETYEMDTTSPEMDTELTKMIDDAAAQGLQKLEIQLTPQHLGKIVVELTQNTDGALQVIIHTANAKSTGLLSQHLDSLNTALQNLGHNQVHVEVERSQDSSSPQQHPFQQADPDGRGQRQEQEQQHKQSQSDSDDFLQQLRLGLFSLEETI